MISGQYREHLTQQPTAQALLARAAAIREGELKKAFGQLKGLSEDERGAVAVLAAAITDGILRRPLERLTLDAVGSYDGVLRDLFGLE